MNVLGKATECPACKKESQYQYLCPHRGRSYRAADRLNILLNIALVTTTLLLLGYYWASAEWSNLSSAKHRQNFYLVFTEPVAHHLREVLQIIGQATARLSFGTHRSLLICIFSPLSES